MRSTTRLRNMLQAGTTVVAPGCYDGLSARMVAQAYASGGAIARSNGIPDIVQRRSHQRS